MKTVKGSNGYRWDRFEITYIDVQGTPTPTTILPAKWLPHARAGITRNWRTLDSEYGPPYERLQRWIAE